MADKKPETVGRCRVTSGTWLRWTEKGYVRHAHNDGTRFVDDVTLSEFKARPHQLQRLESLEALKSPFVPKNVSDGTIDTAKDELKNATVDDVETLRRLKESEQRPAVIAAIDAKLRALNKGV